MNKIKTSTFVEISSRALALFTVALVVTVSAASAKEHKPKNLARGAKWSLTSHSADCRLLTWKCRER